jgi:hypothetical protein
MSRQLSAVAEKVLLLPANVIRGLPTKSALSESMAKTGAGKYPTTATAQYGKLGWKNFWPPQYSKVNPRLPPYPETIAQCLRMFPYQLHWEYVPGYRFLFYSAVLSFFIMRWVDNRTMLKPDVKEALTAMVMDDLNEQRRVLYQHTQKHEDHHYFRHKGCHDGHPLGHGVTDPHVL